MVEAVGVLCCIWGHEDTCAEQSIWHPCSGCALVKIALDMLASAGMVDGYLEVLFQVSEEFRELRWAGVKWEAFRPEDRAAGDTVGHVVQEVLTVAGDWVSEVVRWDSDADGGSSSGD